MDAMAKARHSAGKLAFGGKIKRTLCGVQGGDKTSHWNAGVVLSGAA
jgi:hypothetical protein